MASALLEGNTYGGGLSFSSQALTLGALNGSAINGGFNFDLPLATVAAFNNQALQFASDSSANRFGFMKSVLETSGEKFMNLAQYSVGALESINARTSNTFMNINANIPRGGGGGGGCFITTAVCESMGLPDDCEELTLLRKFRDEYMMVNLHGKKLVKAYYEIAPEMVKEIDSRKHREVIYWAMRKYFITPAIERIKAGDNHGAFMEYLALVKFANSFKGA